MCEAIKRVFIEAGEISSLLVKGLKL